MLKFIQVPNVYLKVYSNAVWKLHNSVLRTRWHHLSVVEFYDSSFMCIQSCVLCFYLMNGHGPLSRYAKLRVVHAPGMPGTFTPPPRVRDPDTHHGTCVTHVPWCMTGSLTSDFLWSRWPGNVPSIPGECTAHNFTYLPMLSIHMPDSIEICASWLLFCKTYMYMWIHIILRNWDGTGNWNLSPWRTMTSLSYMMHVLAADGLVMQGARVSVFKGLA